MEPVTTHEWAAGIIDGEGYFGYNSQKKTNGTRYKYPALSVSQSSDVGVPALLVRLVSLYGGAVHGPYKHPRKPNQRPQYRWVVSCSTARSALPQFWPWLGEVKRAQALSVGFKEPNLE